ncbi:MAG: hypothetical protein IT236_15330 [Bacteroidia bacterium]|nr:hypothetical protein [Bacteroidia bacterium]
MKKNVLILASIGLMGFTACKKDRVCECTNTYTSSSGNVTTDPVANVTYVDARRMDAKSLCQKSTVTTVNSSGATSSQVNDCKLK